MAFYVYIVTNRRNGTLYIGHTDNIERRVFEHKHGILRGFASKYGCTRLVWYSRFGTRDAALTRERQMKAWRRDWKIALIETENPGWRELSADWHPLRQRHCRMPYRPAAMGPGFRQEGGVSAGGHGPRTACPTKAGDHGSRERSGGSAP